MPSHAPRAPESSRLDAEGLSTQRAAKFANTLGKELDRLGFDRLNDLLRTDYGADPLAASSWPQIEKDLARLVPAHMTPEESALMRAMLLGRAVDPKLLSGAFGAAGKEILKEGIELGLFKKNRDGTVGLDNLLLCSHALINGETVYCFADVPSYAQGPVRQSERVYLARDSYFLNAKLQTLSGVEGTVVEFGSGSGIQLITTALCNPGVSKLVGIEIDERARNVSKFNMALNRVKASYETISLEGLSDLVTPGEVSLAISNPPFLAVPRSVTTLDGKTVDLSQAFPKAGWGGENGLVHTRAFIQAISPYLKPSGEIVLYSQFAGNAAGPVDLPRVAVDYDFKRIEFEKFPESEFRTTTHIESKDWGKIMAQILRTSDSRIDVDVQAAVIVETGRMLENRGITKLHSGFFTLSAASTSDITHGKLREVEDKLQLWNDPSRNRASLFITKMAYVGSDVEIPMGVGGEDFKGNAKARHISLDEVLLERKLRGGATLQAGLRNGDYVFKVSDGATGRTIGSGLVYENSGSLSEGYLSAIKAVDTLQPKDVLRNWIYSDCKVVDAKVMNDVIGTRFSGHYLIEMVDVTHTLKITRYIPNPRMGLETGMNDRPTLFSGSILDPKTLPILKALSDAWPDYPGWKA